MADKPLKTLNFGGNDTYYLNPDFEKIEVRTFYVKSMTEVDSKINEIWNLMPDHSVCVIAVEGGFEGSMCTFVTLRKHIVGYGFVEAVSVMTDMDINNTSAPKKWHKWRKDGSWGNWVETV